MKGNDVTRAGNPLQRMKGNDVTQNCIVISYKRMEGNAVTQRGNLFKIIKGNAVTQRGDCYSIFNLIYTRVYFCG